MARRSDNQRQAAKLKAFLWARVEKLEGGCWRWTGALNAGMYPHATVSHRRGYPETISGSHIAWWAVRGEWPAEQLRRLPCCNRTDCVNPDHMQLSGRKLRNQGPRSIEHRQAVAIERIWREHVRAFVTIEGLADRFCVHADSIRRLLKRRGLPTRLV